MGPQPGEAQHGGWPPPASTAVVPVPVPREALDYPVLYNPAPAVERWVQRKRTRNSRVVSIVLSVGISAALWWFYRDDLGDVFWWIAGVSLGLALLQFGWAAAQAVRARRAIDRLHEGLALGIGRGGLYAHDAYLPWSGVAGITTRPGRFGDSPSLVIRPAGGAPPLTLPLDFLGQKPAAIDGAIRALSGGRAWVDLAELDA